MKGYKPEIHHWHITCLRCKKELHVSASNKLIAKKYFIDQSHWLPTRKGYLCPQCVEELRKRNYLKSIYGI